MIEDRDVQRLGRTHEFPRRLAVGVARHCIAARVIVSKHQCGTAEPGGVDNDVPDRHADRLRLPGIRFDVEAAGAAVDVRDQQPLNRVLAGKTGREKPSRRLVTVEKCGKFGTLKPHPHHVAGAEAAA